MFSFQQPRRGLDELNRTLFIAGIAALLGGMFFRYGTWPKIVLTAISAAAILFAVIRMFSQNSARVYQQNTRYLTMLTSVRDFFRGKGGGEKLHRARKARKNPTWSEIKRYKYFVCPQCAQRLRVPRGKGKLRVTCTKCGNRFETKS